MKRVNSNSWKKPFDRDIRPSQDSAYISSQDHTHNSQCMEFSPASHQDLFGQHSQSQTEKMSMYEKWLNNRSLCSKSNQSNAIKGNDGLGRPASMTTPSSSHLKFGVQRFKADERDEQRELLETLLSNSQESKLEMKGLVSNLQEVLEKIGGAFNNQTKAVLSSFMEDIVKSHESLISHIDSSKNKDNQEDLKNQIASKNGQIANLEYKLNVLEDQVQQTKTDNHKQATEFQEEMKSWHETVVNKLEKMTEAIGCQKDAVNQCGMNVKTITEQNTVIGKDLQAGVKESEDRIMKELKGLPADLKNTLDLTPDKMWIFEKLPVDIECSLKTKLQTFSKDIKSELSKVNKRNSDQVLRKQFDKIVNRINSLATEHKKIQQFVTSAIQDFVAHPLKDIDKRVRDIKDNSSFDSTHVRQLQQCIADCKEGQSQHLQNMSAQQKEFSEEVRNVLKNSIESMKYTDKRRDSCSNEKKSPFYETIANSMTSPRDDEVNDRNCSMQEMNFQYQNLRNCQSPSNQVIHKMLDAKVNNIHMPVINQTNIYPTSRGVETFKTPFLSLVSNKQRHMITNKSISDNSPVCHLKRSINTYSNSKPSPIAAIKPQSRITDNHDMVLKEITLNEKESQKLTYKLANSNEVQAQNNDQVEIGDINSNKIQEKGYWLRKRNETLYRENGWIREALKRTTDTRKNSSHSNTRCLSYTNKHDYSSTKGTPHGSSNRDERRNANMTHHSIPVNRKRHRPGQNQETNALKAQSLSVYDFKGDSYEDTRPELPDRRAINDYEERSSVSSVDLTLNLDWANSLLVKKRKQAFNSGSFQARNLTEDHSPSILDIQ